MDTRRSFFKKTAKLTGGVSLVGALLPSIERAAAIPPPDESTFLDAEHIVILMQENRSFDHAFGSLRGVRGFNDPRAVSLPNQNPVWLQTNAAGETYAPFRLDAQRTNATWLGSLPHSWTDQNDAKNGGDHDQWLIAKPAGHSDPPGMPLTMGHYVREDLPFYYALADAFTICDQHFCSSLTGTTPNRLYLWSGTIREQQNASSPANVRNENVGYTAPAHWTTFPERLEDAGVSWKIYQNELSVASGLTKEEDAWLAGFEDNPIEWFPQFAVQFAKNHCEHIARLSDSLPGEIAALEKQVSATETAAERTKLEKDLKAKRDLLSEIVAEQQQMSGKSFDELPARTRNLHLKAFTTNAADPDYRTLTALEYEDGSATRELQIPKGDILHQFRADVAAEKLPAISWIVAPEKFSDHPTAAWYGAWYVAEVMNILTQNPEVWRKTIFILTYDENDGFFDHVPPFGAPRPGFPETGAVSSGIGTDVEYVTLEQDLARESAAKARGGSIGLGFRVPLVVASPWSRGGAVCSQVFDHTSVLQLLEKFASHKTSKSVKETNISDWRRTVCGDLTSVFQSSGERLPKLPFPAKNAFIERIYNAQFQGPPAYRALSPLQVEECRHNPQAASSIPHQEPGLRSARALPYELYAEARLSGDRQSLELTLSARKERFGERAAGSPFHVYAPRQYLHNGSPNRTRSYAVKPGDSLQDNWKLTGFPDGRYELHVCGPNGFLFASVGDGHDPLLEVAVNGSQAASAAEVILSFTNRQKRRDYTASIVHNAYGFASQRRIVPPGLTRTVVVNLFSSFGWYDFTISVVGFERFERRYAGHIETGLPSFSDPQMA
ncbi:MAG TPA: phospholipase C, phosphocholine-specific [Bryobacteraceae bacterium]